MHIKCKGSKTAQADFKTKSGQIPPGFKKKLLFNEERKKKKKTPFVQ